jgi:DNA-binding NarL/FixJ family response regulator
MIKILIADGHPIVRIGLKQIVGTTTDIVVVGEATQGVEVINKLRTCDVDLLLLEMAMPDINPVDLIRRVRADQPALPILALSIHDEAHAASNALRAGAAGYVTKNSDLDVLLAAIRKLAGGGRFIDPKLVDAVVFGARSVDASPQEILSNREFEVLCMLAGGKKVTWIAEALAVSAKTISCHKMRLMQKLALGNNVELIRYSVRHGLVSN